MSLQTNLDKRLTPAQIEKIESKERRQAFIQDKTDQAEKALVEGHGAVPDTIYSGLQRGDVISQDPSLDNDPNMVRNLYAQRKPLPIKQQEVTPEGDWVITLAPEFVEALKQKLWCHQCYEPQPDNDIEWGAAMLRLERVIGPKPVHAAHGVMCCYCGANLGLSGDHKEDALSLLKSTPEQRELLETMFGPISSGD